MVSALNRAPPEVMVAADELLVSVTVPRSLKAPALEKLPPTVTGFAPVSPPAATSRLPVTERASSNSYDPPLPSTVSAPKLAPPEVIVPAVDVPVNVTSPVSV
jgi:hypothetical protein